jgi:hypothetical protein
MNTFNLKRQVVRIKIYLAGVACRNKRLIRKTWFWPVVLSIIGFNFAIA